MDDKSGMPSNSANTGKILGVIAAVAVVGAVGISAFRSKSSEVAQPMTTTSSTNGTSMGQMAYKNGSYSADGGYRSPAGQESVSITVTIQDNTITQASFTGHATNPVSVRMQGNFKNGFEQQVVGKKVDDVALTVVNGASLAPKGFMEALNKVKVEAKA